MTDRHDEYDAQDDAQDEPREAVPPRGPGEGVRILGAEEAQAALDAGSVARRLGDEETRFGDVPPRPDPSVRPAARFPRPSDEPLPEVEPRHGDASGFVEPMPAGGAAVEPELPEATPYEPLPEVSGAPELPHWTEPPTGEMPIILPEAESGEGLEDEDGALAAAASTSPRFRTGMGDWTDGDFEPIETLGDEGTDVGALRSPPEDYDTVFEREVEARRHRTPGRRAGGGGGGARRPPTEEAQPAAQADLATRVITGIGIAVLALVCLKYGRSSTMVLATAIIGVAAFEFFQALHRRGFRPATLVAILGCVAVTPIAYDRGEFAFGFVLALVTVFSLLWYLLEVVHSRPIVNAAVTVFGFAYVGILGGFAGLLLAFEDGVGLILGAAICVVGYDVVGYLIGSQFGKTRLAPSVSPNKTFEGLIGGMVASIALALLVVKWIAPWGGFRETLALGFTIAVMAPLGDLCESMLKRDLGIKDFGSVLPGHGGLMDRFDALLFCLPATYYLARALDIIG
ncbi:MAG: hypothetical protein FJW88_04540 [Actinobacteria bacterium]|nr:hypothetical protein [Actinomycetota bacterium]